MKFSACWIAKNEEKNILRSIESLSGVVDELVIIDTGSTDNTVAIAESAGAKMGFFEWVGDFSAARNYALSQTTGDVVFFLDADEWFSPALTRADRDKIEGIFTEFPELDAIQLKICNLNSQGVVKTTSVANRILRPGKGCHFIKQVHEQYVRGNDAPPNAKLLTDWQIDHCGYVEEIMDAKMARNIELLEAAAESAASPVERHLQHCYLVREYFQIDDTDSSLRHLKKVLEEPDMIKLHCIQFYHGFAPLLYNMLLMSSEAKARGSVSRMELHRKIVTTFRKNIRDYPGNATIELLYSALFDIKDDVLLSQIAPALEAAAKIPESQISFYREAEMVINQHAAEASFRRGRLTDAMDYTVASFKHTQSKNPAALHILLSCMRGIEAKEIIPFLNSQFDLTDPNRLEYLSKGTRMHGFREVHAYYLDKRIKAGLATKEDYLYLLLLYGHYGSVAQAGRELYNEDVADVVGKSIFMAAVCSNDKQLYLDNAEYLKGYKHVLDAYFSHSPIGQITNIDYRILLESYRHIALAAGIECADRLRSLYASQPLLQFQIKGSYCVDNGLYQELLAEIMPEPEDLLSNIFVINCLTMTGRCEEAYMRIKHNLDKGRVDGILLQYLLAVADRSPGELKKRANELYQRYIEHYESFIDMRDTVNTGYITEDTDKKKSRTYKSLTVSQFQKQFAEENAKPYIDGFAELSEKAGAMFDEKGMPASAMERYRFSLAQGHNKDENRERLLVFFKDIGNNQIVAELRKL